MMLTAIIIMGAIGLPVGWYLLRIPRQTYYRPISGDETSGINAGKTEAKNAMIKKVTWIGGGYMFLCLCVLSTVWMIPKVKTVQAALNPTATPTVTYTPTVTFTPTVTNTPAPTRTVLSTLTAGTVTKASTTQPTTVAATATPKIIYQTISQTKIVPVYRTVVVTVVVFQTVIVTPTHTPTPTETMIITETFTPTLTPTATETLTETPTETPTGALP